MRYIQINKQTTLFVLSCMGALVLCFFAILGMFSRPQNDDFYYLAHVGPEAHQNFNWSSNGRISSQIAYFLLYPIHNIDKIAPAFSIVLLVVGLSLFIHSVIRLRIESSRDQRIVTVFSSIWLTVAIIFTLPAVYPAFYWFIALPPHTWSICLLLAYTGIYIKRFTSNKPWNIWHDILLFLLLPVIVGTFYETTAILMLCLSSLGLLIVLYKKLYSKLFFNITSVVASLISLAVLLFSPGALRRRGLNTESGHDGLVSALHDLCYALYHNFFSIIPSYLGHWSLLIIVTCIGVVIGIVFMHKTSLKKGLVRISLTVLAIIFCITCEIVAVWMGLHEYISQREMLKVVIPLLVGLFFIGTTVGSVLKARYSHRVVVILAAFTTLLFVAVNQAYIPNVYHFYSGIKQYASQWDKRNDVINSSVANGTCNIGVPALTIDGMWDISNRKNYWVNNAMTYYYDVQSNGNSCRVYATEVVKPLNER